MVIGGTGLAASTWAGLIAILNQGLGHNLGFFNPLLYQKLGPAGVFRSVLNGHNGSPELSGFCAGPGWNAATGWGSPDGTRLLQALKSTGK
jgi:kumamolisin